MTYSDSTTNVSFLYNRLGRQQQVTQGTLTNTFAYNDCWTAPG